MSSHDSIEAQSELMLLPALTRQAINNYLDHGLRPGSFLRAVLENDLHTAIARADADNREALGHIVAWVCKWAPYESFGNPVNVDKWLTKKLIERGEAAEESTY